MTIYFGFALADSMFSGACTIEREIIDVETVRELAKAGTLVPCLNPSHKATIDAMNSRFGISLEIPDAPPRVSVGHGDSVIVMGVRGLPRLTDRHEYTEEEIASATFSFSRYSVV
jgi:hypothetical protein